MQDGKSLEDCLLTGIAALTTILMLIGSAAGQLKTIARFNGNNGSQPYAGVIVDAAGNLYGTSYGGGLHNGGLVFELKPDNGKWRESLLHQFGYGPTEGVGPYAGLTFDNSGNLYGTTEAGGGVCNCGAVFELTPSGGGGWKERAIHSFEMSATDGYQPEAGVIFDSSGNLYGTTFSGGEYKAGTVYEMSPSAGGQWTETVIYDFNIDNGASPTAGLIFDGGGNLYGTAWAGGAYGYGTVFELSPGVGGVWAETVLYSFGGSASDGQGPYAGLAFDSAGNLYGTTFSGGVNQLGIVFELSPTAGGIWTEETLHSFDGEDGAYPYGTPALDAEGNLYGTVLLGGAGSDGTVFELQSAHGWAMKMLHQFSGKDGNGPYAGVTIDASGHLYGTTFGGGSGDGTVFQITP